VRYLVTLILLFVQLTRCFTAAAEAHVPLNEVSHEKSASFQAGDLLHDQSAEVARTIQFTCVAFAIRDHRITEGTVTVAHLSDYIAGDLRKRINASPTPHWSPLIRSLLFPNHYFW
jgi:hypothetical protein